MRRLTFVNDYEAFTAKKLRYHVTVIYDFFFDLGDSLFIRFHMVSPSTKF